ncbi:MAG: zinc-ribbon domain-containing protein [Clostridia bacterium]|nr:zinc-ribbon domain-containing protein [Clostridia bacterium]
MYCQNCGSKLPDGAKFCSNCGAKAAAAPSQPKEEPQQPSGQPSQPAPAEPVSQPPVVSAQQNASPKKKKSPVVPVVLCLAALAAAAVLFVTLILPKLRGNEPAGQTSESAADVSTADKTDDGSASGSDNASEVPEDAAKASPYVADIVEDTALEMGFVIRQGLDEPTSDKVFEAPSLDGWGDPFGVQLDELTLVYPSGDPAFTICVESACSLSYAYLSGDRYYGDGLDVTAYLTARAGDKYLFCIKNTDGGDSTYYIYDKEADELSYLGYFSEIKLFGNYIFMRPFNDLGESMPVLVFDWAGKEIKEIENVYSIADEDGYLYILSGFNKVSLDKIPLESFDSVRPDFTAGRVADFPDNSFGLLSKTYEGKLCISMFSSDGSAKYSGEVEKAADIAKEMARDPAPGFEPISASCKDFSVTMPAFFADLVDVEVEDHAVALYYIAPSGLHLLCGLRMVNASDVPTISWYDEVVGMVMKDGNECYLIEERPADVDYENIDVPAWDALRSRLKDFTASVEYIGADTVYPAYHELPERYEDENHEYRLRIIYTDFADLKCTFCKLDGRGDVEDKTECDVKMVGSRGVIYDGTYAIGELRLEDGNIYLAEINTGSQLSASDITLYPVEQNNN